MMTIATVYRPTSGDIYVFGRSVTTHGDEVRRYIGIAFQEPKALWVDKVHELLMWHARVVGYSKQQAREVVKDVMETLGIWEYRNKMISELSGGNKKKVELAKVFIQRPKLAIFDEPTAQLDVVTKHMVWNMIKELRKAGSTIIVATNDMSEAEQLSDRIAIIYKGRLKAVGTPEYLKDTIPGGDIIEVMFEGSISTPLLETLSRELQARKINKDTNVIKIYVNKGEEKLAKAIDIFARNNIKIRKILMKEPTLDDVFFYYTGATLEATQ